MIEVTTGVIQTGKPSNRLLVFVEIIAVALIYFITARIGQIFAIPPGNITPVWIPSGIILALVIFRGYYIWPGIFIGAFAGNAWAYIDFNSTELIIKSIVSGTSNGIGDVLCALLPVYLLKRYLGTANLFKSLRHYWYFLVTAVIAGPLISAVFGATSLAALGFLDWSDYTNAFMTWWIGDAVGVLIIAPAILIFKYRSTSHSNPIHVTEMMAFLVTAAGLAVLIIESELVPHILPPANYLMIPLLFWALVRLNQRTVYLTLVFYTAVTVYATSQNIGPFSAATQITALIQMQGFLSMLAISVYIVSALFNERTQLVNQLEERVSRDLLTQARSRLYFEEQLKQEIIRFDRQHIPFCLIMFDIDDFKALNDNYGHLVGDEILRGIVAIVEPKLRQTDTIARWGGDEFMILLPGANADGAESFAESLRMRVKQYQFLKNIHITISLSVHQYTQGKNYNNFLTELDQGLLKAKNEGRNRTTVVLQSASY
jgi:diguanylate cyclase (GGDEF)-like protein